MEHITQQLNELLVRKCPMFRSICILTATLFVFSSTSSAHVRLGRRYESYPVWRGEVTPYLGFVDFGGITSEALDLYGSSGGIFGVEFGFFATRYLEVGFNIGDIPTSTLFERSGPYMFSPDIESFVGADILLTDFNLLYNLSQAGKNVVPFLQAGIGRESIFYDGIFDRGFTTYSLGAGVRARLHHRVSFNMSFRHYRTFVMEGDLNLNQARLGLSILF